MFFFPLKEPPDCKMKKKKIRENKNGRHIFFINKKVNGGGEGREEEKKNSYMWNTGY